MEKVGIIGGTGQMGALFSGVFSRAGHTVLVSGRRTPGITREILESCRVVMVSVPIAETVALINSIAGEMRSDQVLCDLTSLKEAPVRAMLASKAEVIGFHPMFGPSAGAVAGQTIIATPARCSVETLSFFKDLFMQEGAIVTCTTPEVHDRMMAVVQGLTHYVTLLMAGTMVEAGISPQDTLPFMSPVYRLEMGMAGRILSQDPGLYRDILRLNPYLPAVLAAGDKASSALQEAVLGPDPDPFMEYFSACAEHFGEYRSVAMEETDEIIRRMIR